MKRRLFIMHALSLSAAGLLVPEVETVDGAGSTENDAGPYWGNEGRTPLDREHSTVIAEGYVGFYGASPVDEATINTAYIQGKIDQAAEMGGGTVTAGGPISRRLTDRGDVTVTSSDDSDPILRTANIYGGAEHSTVIAGGWGRADILKIGTAERNESGGWTIEGWTMDGAYTVSRPAGVDFRSGAVGGWSVEELHAISRAQNGGA